MRTLLREPLLHFLVGAAAIVALQQSTGEEEPRDDVIVVDRAALLRTLQARRGRYEEGAAEAELDAMSPGERQALIDSYVREEALYREALQLGLDEEDYVVRRRLGQSVELMTRGLSGVDSIAEETLRERFESERERYRLSPTRTIQHAFFAPADRSEQGFEAAMARASAAAASDAIATDPFPAGERFERASERTLATTFGPELAEALFELPVRGGWQGPLRSSFGAHLVRVEEQQPGALPTFEQVRGRIEVELRDERERDVGDAAVQALVDRYRVELELAP